MARFTQRLVTAEHRAAAAGAAKVTAELRHSLPSGRAGAAVAGAVAADAARKPADLLAAIRRRVKARLVKGSPALHAARAQLNQVRSVGSPRAPAPPSATATPASRGWRRSRWRRAP